MSKDRSWDFGYLQKQYEAMRWLHYELGISPDEIRLYRWGAVNEGDKTLRITKKIVDLKTSRAFSGVVKHDERERTFYIELKGTPNEWFFLKSKLSCPWMFTRERPTTWRREGSKSSLFTPGEIRRILIEDSRYVENSTPDILKEVDIFGILEVSNLNITKMETKELERKAIELPETTVIQK